MTKQGIMTRAVRLFPALLFAMVAIATAVHAAAQGEKTAVTVNGEIITEQEFFERLQRLHGQAFVAPGNQLRTETAGMIVLDAMISEHLLLQAASKAKLSISDAEIGAELANLKRQPQVVAGLTGHLYTEEMLKYDIRIQGARFKLATMGVKVSADDVEKYYKAHTTDYTTPESWAVSVIRTANLDTLAKIDTDLKAGKSFAETAKLYSDDIATKDKGGESGSIYATDTRIPATLLDAVKLLKPGAITPAIKLEQDAGSGKPKIVTWWRILLRSKEPESIRPLNDIKGAIERLALLEKAGGIQAGDKRVADLRSQSDIKVNLPGYESLAAQK